MEEIKDVIEKIKENREAGIDSLLSRVNGKTSKIIEKAYLGDEITIDEGEHLFLLEDPEALAALCLAADDIRKQDVGDVITYVINRNINFTNICYTWCGFCNFMAPEGDERAYFLTMDEIKDKVVEAWEHGATEVCMQGGMHPDISRPSVPNNLFEPPPASA